VSSSSSSSLSNQQSAPAPECIIAVAQIVQLIAATVMFQQHQPPNQSYTNTLTICEVNSTAPDGKGTSPEYQDAICGHEHLASGLANAHIATQSPAAETAVFVVILGVSGQTWHHRQARLGNQQQLVPFLPHLQSSGQAQNGRASRRTGDAPVQTIGAFGAAEELMQHIHTLQSYANPPGAS
jgi:hypothetical protein